MSEQAVMEEVVDAHVVPDDEPTPTTTAVVTTTAVARRERRSEVIRPLDADQLVESFDAYQALLPKLLKPDDYQQAGRGKKFVKKSGWRKIATAFDLDVQIIRSEVERDHDGQPCRAEVWARAIAPSGRSMDGDGYCSVDEERFTGPRGNRSKLENDLRATATTRAMNRAISGLVGMGEVSAEEIDAHAGQHVQQGPAFGPAATDSQQGQAIRALRAALEMAGSATSFEHATKVIAKMTEDAGGYLPAVSARAVGHLAAAMKHAHDASASDAPGATEPDAGDPSDLTAEELAELRERAEATE